MTKAVILAAGKGTRMGDLTQEIPKPMLEVQGRPILEHIVEGLKEVGIRQFHLITGWRAEVIESHFGDGSRFGVEMSYSRQVVQDGTGKAPELAKEFVGQDDFVLTYGDILVKPETYRHMIERWQAGRFDGVLTVTAAEDVTKGGLFFFDDAQFCLTRLVEKPNASQLETLRAEGWICPGKPVWYNAGIYLFKPSLFAYTARLEKSPRGEYELTDALSMMVAEGRLLAGRQIAGRWVDVRDPEVLASLQA